MESRRRQIRITAVRWTLYTLIMLLAATFQSMPGFLAFGAFKPNFLLGVAIAVALYEGEFRGALFGAVCGLLWDYLAGRTVGMLALCLMLLCFFVSILVQLYLKPSTVNFILIMLGAGLLLLSTDFLFFYWMPGYANPAWRYLTVVLPEVLASAALGAITNQIIKAIANRFTLIS